MFNHNTYADIILPLPVRGFFTYKIPENISAIAVGTRVLVPFGKKKIYTGIVAKIHNNKPTDFEIKPIFDTLENHPSVTQKQLQLWQWSADYYLCPVGDFLKASLPSGMRLESETTIIPVITTENLPLNNLQNLIYQLLLKHKKLSIQEIGKISGKANPIKLISELVAKNAALIQEEVIKKYKPKTIKYIGLKNPDLNTNEILLLKNRLSRSPKQQALFNWFLKLNSGQQKNVQKQKLLAQSKISTAVLQALINKNILKEFEVETSRITTESLKTVAKKSLNKQQQKALEQINQSFTQKQVVLLHGVTSSGKTEIYIHLIEQTLKQKQQVLYLLPEIAITSQIINRLKSVFGNQVGVYHSKFSNAERVEIYNNLAVDKEKSFNIILGVRSSVFLPFNNLGLIIVDEEHENTYKQFDPSPRYNARDLSVVLAAIHKSKVLLGSATPSIESYYNAQTGRYGLVELHQRYQNIQMPEIVVADIKRAYKKKQMQANFTPQLMQLVQTALAQNEQVILFQNRRGFSPYLECESCGWVPKCKHCDVSLTYHKSINKLICHYCGYTTNSVSNCPACGHQKVATKGFGTEKIEDDVKIMFPDAKVARLDMDTTQGKYSHEKIITDFQNQHIDILIGTQMVSKGLDFDDVSVVGVLNADNMLRFPDFRAYERSYQLMAQVSGRAGRKNKQGKVVIQTYDTENSIIKQVKNNHFLWMYETQLKEREAFFYPPFSRLIKITLKHRDKITINAGADYLSKQLHQHLKSKILGPSTPPIIRIQNLYLKTILIKIHKGSQTLAEKTAIRNILAQFGAQNKYKSIRIIVDVDPM